MPASTTSFGGLKRWSTLSSGAHFGLPRCEWRPDELLCPLAWLSTGLGQLGASCPADRDVLGIVEQNDETHPLRLKKGRRKTTLPNTSTGISRCRSLRPSRERFAPSIREH
uniref:Uncharacterized protein n=1 Tax=Peronospora matthiolae TaxID=2874970 RepID=A0AAV1TV27_9STRA